MSDSVSKTNKKTSKPDFNPQNFFMKFRKWIYVNRIYVLAFLIPAVIVYIAYVLFDAYPFGDHSVLVLDLNGQYIYFFEALRDAFWGDESLLYSWSRNLSGEYMGIIGYYLASPFTLIVMLFPRSMILGSVMIMQLAKIGSAGLTFCIFLQKTRNIKLLNSLIFAIMYALMSYAVVQLMDPMWLDGLVFMPLIAYGVELLVDGKKRVNYIIPLAIMFFANFYIGYMIGIFTLLYFLYYVFFGSEKTGRKGYEIFGIFVKFAYSTVIAVMCAAVMLLPVYYALQLGKIDFSNPDFSFRLSFTAADFFTNLLPNTYDTVRNEGSPNIYCGMLVVLMLPLFYMNTNIKSRKKIGYSLLALLVFLSMYIEPVDIAWHGFQSPNWLPFRYSFLFSFVILCMAAEAFDSLEGISKKAIGGSVFGIAAYLIYIDKVGYENIQTVSTIWFALACIIAFAIIIRGIQSNEKSKGLRILLLLIVCAELVSTSHQTFEDIDEDVGYSSHASYYSKIDVTREIVDALEEEDSSLYRSEKTYYRMTNDNLATGLKGITHSSSVMNTKILDFIGSLGYTQRSYYSRYSGATPISDSLLGIKYVIDKDNDVSSIYNPLWEYDEYTVYQNPQALSIGYMVDDSATELGTLDSSNPFENQNTLLNTLLGSSSNPEEYFKPLTIDGDPVLRNVTAEKSSDQVKYIKGSGDPTIEYHITAETSDSIYMFLYTTNEKKVNVWVGTEKDPETGEFVTGTFQAYGQYFEGHYYRILDIGSYEPGQEIAVRLTIQEESDYTVVKEPYFYYLDVDSYQTDMEQLLDQQWNITDWSSTNIKGSIEAQSNQVMMTSIPYEPGWTIKVDGQKVEPVVIADALIGIPMSAGTHEVEMSFIPKGLIPGILLAITGIGFCVLIYLNDSGKLKEMRAKSKSKK